MTELRDEGDACENEARDGSEGQAGAPAIGLKLYEYTDPVGGHQDVERASEPA